MKVDEFDSEMSQMKIKTVQDDESSAYTRRKMIQKCDSMCPKNILLLSFCLVFNFFITRIIHTLYYSHVVARCTCFSIYDSAYM